MAAVLVVHMALVWGLLQIDSLHQAAVDVAPLFVSLLLPPAPQPAPAAAAPLPRPRPARPPARVVAAAPPPTPPALAAPAPSPEPVQAPPVAAAVAEAVAAAAPAPSTPAVEAAPRAVPLTSVRYITQPEPAYPTTSRRLGETGEVRLRVEIDTDGRVRQISLHRSSGFPRLDESAMAAMRSARFAPYTENGVALVVWTIVPIGFELKS